VGRGGAGSALRPRAAGVGDDARTAGGRAGAQAAAVEVLAGQGAAADAVAGLALVGQAAAAAPHAPEGVAEAATRGEVGAAPVGEDVRVGDARPAVAPARAQAAS
jgi:hypothetical protein